MVQTSSPRLGYPWSRSTVQPLEWSVSNFKSLEHASLPLRGLTVLTGANSSGKSSLIQSLLLLAQSPDDEIILNGPLVRLGEAADIIRSGSNSLTFSYSIQTRTSDDAKPLEWSFSLEFGAGRSSLEILEFDAAVDGVQILSATSSRVTAAAKSEANPGQRFGNTVLRVREVFGHQAPARTYLSFRGFHVEALITRRKKDRVLASLRRTYSKRAIDQNIELLFRLYDELHVWWMSHQKDLPEDVVALYGEIFQRGASPARFEHADSGTLDKLFQLYAEAVEEEGWQPVPVSRYWAPSYRGTGLYGRTLFGIAGDFREALKGLSIANDGLHEIRASVRYLGPLREEPQVVSLSGGRNRSLPAGIKGEYTADLLAREKNTPVDFFDWAKSQRQLKLPDAVSLWTTYLGVGDKVAVEDQGKLGRGLRLQVHGISRDLTTVGVGASQLLPVISVVLAADQDSTVCIEQPELHLHPAVQSRLADFFLFARPDITLIIETHSEYMITRIRRRAAERSASIESVSVFFAEQEDGVTNIRRLHLNAQGDFSDWPRGFFDTQDEDARALVHAIAESVSGIEQ